MIVGVVGKTNCGKSTFFKATTLAEVEIADRPFVTLKPNQGVGYVKINCVDKEFNKQCNPQFGFCLENKRFVPVKLIDVAGLVPGAHKGLGRGNEFLSDLNQADVLVHILDISGSTNEKGENVKPLSYDPLKDIKFLEEELDMWYFGLLKKGWDKFSKSVKNEAHEIKISLAKQLTGLKVNEDMIEKSIKKLKLTHHPRDWTDQDLKDLSRELRIKSKPMIIAANKIDVEGSKLNLHKLQEEFKNHIIIGCSAETELALREAAKKELIKYLPGNNKFEVVKDVNEKQKEGLNFIKKFLEENKTTGVQEILNKAVFDLLKYIAVYPVANSKLEDKDGNILPGCFLISEDSTALEFAYKIHKDIGDGFIRAIDMKTKRVISRESKLKHLDVIEIITKK